MNVGDRVKLVRHHLRDDGNPTYPPELIGREGSILTTTAQGYVLLALVDFGDTRMWCGGIDLELVKP